MNLLKKGLYFASALYLCFAMTSCEDDDSLNIIAGLNFNIATLNAVGTETGVIPTTIPPDGRIVYTVDFGDPNSEDDVFETSGPMVSYTYPEESVTYTITVTATRGKGVADVSISKEHTVVYTPPVVNNPGEDGGIVGTWKIAPEAGSIGVGPGRDNLSWFAIDEAGVAQRDCFYDDLYVFNEDGTFENVLGAETWVEPWQGTDPEACGAPVFPHDGSASATYTYNEAAGTITINGTGAFLGLAKVTNDGELASPSGAPESITYQAKLDGDVLELDIQFDAANDAWWSFKLVRDVPSLVGTWKIAPEAASIGVGPGRDNLSWFAIDDAGVAQRDCFYDDLYVFNEDGTFENVLGAETWVEPWQGTDPEACSAPVFPHDGSASATYTYDATAGTITINGTGAFLGLAKVTNSGELASPSGAPDSITYQAKLEGDVLELDIQFDAANDAWWSFKLVRE